MRALLLAGVVALGWGGAAQATSYTYVGSWILGDGPDWTTSPPLYTGQSAAALLFGGNASDYAISTIDNLVADINYEAFYDTYGVDILTAYSDEYTASTNGNDTYSSSGSSSAYVHDHSCFNRYGNLAASCSGDGTQYVNYAFRIAAATDVPEPASFALLGMGVAGIAAVRGRRAS